MPTKPKPIPRERKSGKDFKIGEAPSRFKKGLTPKRKKVRGERRSSPTPPLSAPTPLNKIERPEKKKRKKTFKEANADLKKRQEGLKIRNMVRDAMGSKLDDPNTRVEIDGKEAKGLKKGGKIRGYGLARGGKVCKMR